MGLGEIHFLIFMCVDWHVLVIRFAIVVKYFFSFFCVSPDLPSSILLICCMALGINISPLVLSYLICTVAFVNWFVLLGEFLCGFWCSVA